MQPQNIRLQSLRCVQRPMQQSAFVGHQFFQVFLGARSEKGKGILVSNYRFKSIIYMINEVQSFIKKPGGVV